MQTRTADGLTVAHDEAGTGRPLVLLHAFPLSRAMWRPQLLGLADAARVVAPDLRGFGDTGGFAGEPSVDRMADDVAGLLDALGVADKVVLGGLSMGGYVALAFARRHAGRLAGLILADTKAEPDDDAGRKGRDEMIAFAADRTGADVIAKMLPKLLGPTTLAERPEVVAEVTRIGSEQSAGGGVGALRALRDRPDAGPGLANVPVPALVLVGGEDAVTPPAAAKALADRLPRAELVVIDRAGHLSNLERPEAFNAAVRDFLAGL